MLIDEFLPAYDVVERHETRVRASPRRGVCRASPRRTSPARRSCGCSSPCACCPRSSSVAPAPSARPRAGCGGPITLRAFEARGFTILAEDPPRELLIGLVGTFWTPTGGLRASTRRRSAARSRPAPPVPPGTSGSSPDGADCRLTTETRVQCADAESRRRFRWYWLSSGRAAASSGSLMLRSIRTPRRSRGSD